MTPIDDPRDDPHDDLRDDPRAAIPLIARIAAVPSVLSACAATTGMGIAAVARVTQERWVAAAVLDQLGFGLEPGSELPIATTFCQTVRDTGDPVAFDDAATDATWRLSPIPTMYGIASYIAVPILLPDGTFWGTLCGFDPKPHVVSGPDTVRAFRLFADLVGFHIDAQRRLEAGERALERARQEAELREQYIAVLGHDLRNPLAAVDAVARLMRRENPGPRAEGLLSLVEGSVERMAGLIDDTLDFARGRLGGGIPLALEDGVDLAPALRQIVAELASVRPERAVEARIPALPPLRCDPRRVGQLLSNLLGNALEHGAADRPVRVTAGVEGGAFRLEVENGGAPIPEAEIARLFEPFRRGAGRHPGSGLGLGLFIAAEVARAHGGAIEATSDAGGTRFGFVMPVAERSLGPALAATAG